MSEEKKGDSQGTPGWLEFNGLQTHSDVEAVSPVEPYMKGFIRPDDHFDPTPPIVGEVTEAPSEATPGWLAFSPVKFHSMTEGIAKPPPYIDGSMHEENFYPTGSLVVDDS